MNFDITTVISAVGVSALIGLCVTSLTVFQQGKEFPAFRSIRHSCTLSVTTAVAATYNVSTAISATISTSDTDRSTTTAVFTATVTANVTTTSNSTTTGTNATHQ